MIPAQLNINQATKEYLECYVEKKTERENIKRTKNQDLEKENEGALDVEKQEPAAVEGTTKDSNDSEDKENQNHQDFGGAIDEDREADKDALEKITSMIVNWSAQISDSIFLHLFYKYRVHNL